MDVNIVRPAIYFKDNCDRVLTYFKRFYVDNSEYRYADVLTSFNIAIKIVQSECLKMSVNQFCRFVNTIKEEL